LDALYPAELDTRGKAREFTALKKMTIHELVRARDAAHAVPQGRSCSSGELKQTVPAKSRPQTQGVIRGRRSKWIRQDARLRGSSSGAKGSDDPRICKILPLFPETPSPHSRFSTRVPNVLLGFCRAHREKDQKLG